MARNDTSREELLARYFDGEVTKEEKASAEALLREDPKLAREMRAVSTLDSLLRADVQRKVAQVDFSRFADTVLREAEARKTPTVWERIEEFFSERFGKASHILLPSAVAAAAAVAALLVSRPHTPEEKGVIAPQQNEFVITQIVTDKTFMTETIDDEGTPIVWIDDSEE